MYNTCDAIFITQVESKPSITIEKNEISSFIWLTPEKILSQKIGFKSLRTAVQEFITLHAPIN